MRRQLPSSSPRRDATHTAGAPAGVTPAASTDAEVTTRSSTAAPAVPGSAWADTRRWASIVHASGWEPAVPAATHRPPRARTARTTVGPRAASEASRTQ